MNEWVLLGLLAIMGFSHGVLLSNLKTMINNRFFYKGDVPGPRYVLDRGISSSINCQIFVILLIIFLLNILS